MALVASVCNDSSCAECLSNWAWIRYNEFNTSLSLILLSLLCCWWWWSSSSLACEADLDLFNYVWLSLCTSWDVIWEVCGCSSSFIFSRNSNYWMDYNKATCWGPCNSDTMPCNVYSWVRMELMATLLFYAAFMIYWYRPLAAPSIISILSCKLVTWCCICVMSCAVLLLVLLAAAMAVVVAELVLRSSLTTSLSNEVEVSIWVPS